VLCGTRIRYSSLLLHLVGGDLAGGVEEGEDSSDHRLHGGVDLVQSTRVRGLLLKDLDQFKGSMAVTSALGRWSLGARAQRIPDCHQHCKASSGKGAARCGNNSGC
jgi:hypothetical protein